MSTSISAAEVKRLRDMTNAPVGDCKSALVEAAGDMKKAAQILRERNSKIQEKKAERETAEGRIGIWIAPDHSRAAIVELRCESAPVAKNEIFQKLVDDLAHHFAQVGTPASVEEALKQPLAHNKAMTVNERIGEALGLLRENMKLARVAALQGGPFGSYVHFDGSVGVLLQAEGEKNEEVLKDISMHITAKQPVAVRREDVPAEALTREKDIALAQMEQDEKNKNKPQNIKDKIIEGKLKTWLQENVLLDQPFVKDDTKTVDALAKGAKLNLKKFVRYKVGELT
jgi:elongation factor Ts